MIMKKLMILCSVFFISLFAFSSCNTDDNKPDEGQPPVNNEDNPPKEDDSTAVKVELIITTSDGQIVAAAADTEVVFSYEIVNPQQDGVLSVEIPEDNEWIHNPLVDEAAMTVTLSLDENFAEESRSQVITLRYTYGEESVVQVVNIIQDPCLYDYITECSYARAMYYGQGMAQDLNLYCYYFRVASSDLNSEYGVEANSWVYSVDLYFEGETADRLPEPGTYTLVKYGKEVNWSFTDDGALAEYFGDDMIDYSDYRQHQFKEGTVTIDKDENVYSMTAILKDIDGKTHYVKYSGVPVLEDFTNLSSFEEDIEMELFDYDIVAVDYGDYFDVGMRNWQLQIYGDNLEPGDPILYLEILTPMDIKEFSTDILFDNYYAPTTDATSYYIPGEYDEKMSWYVTWGGWEEESTAPSAAILSGSILLEANEDGTFKMTTDLYEQYGYNIKLTMDNMEVWYYDYSGESAAAGVMGKSFAPKPVIERPKPAMIKSR